MQGFGLTLSKSPTQSYTHLVVHRKHIEAFLHRFILNNLAPTMFPLPLDVE